MRNENQRMRRHSKSVTPHGRTPVTSREVAFMRQRLEGEFRTSATTAAAIWCLHDLEMQMREDEKALANGSL